VLPESRPALLARAKAYVAYNAAVSRRERLAGLQLDIEPYLLPGFVLAPGYWRERYLEAFRATHAALDGRLPLDMVVPVWWGGHPAFGDSLWRGMALPGVSLTVMNYRTNPEALRAGARPLLEAGRRHGLPVRMALETGPLGDEARRTYRVAPEGAGELWLFRQASVPFLVLLRSPQARLPGQAYEFAGERSFPGSNLTFGNGKERRETIAGALVREWSDWESFAGLALHGLDSAFP
jgi:hypothetical protein